MKGLNLPINFLTMVRVKINLHYCMPHVGAPSVERSASKSCAFLTFDSKKRLPEKVTIALRALISQASPTLGSKNEF